MEESIAWIVCVYIPSSVSLDCQKRQVLLQDTVNGKQKPQIMQLRIIQDGDLVSLHLAINSSSCRFDV